MPEYIGPGKGIAQPMHLKEVRLLQKPSPLGDWWTNQQGGLPENRKSFSSPSAGLMGAYWVSKEQRYVNQADWFTRLFSTSSW
jgi:hypothetical protein